MFTPKYLIDVMNLRLTPSKVYLYLMLFFFLERVIMLHLTGWKRISHEMAHLPSLLISDCI